LNKLYNLIFANHQETNARLENLEQRFGNLEQRLDNIALLLNNAISQMNENNRSMLPVQRFVTSTANVSSIAATNNLSNSPSTTPSSLINISVDATGLDLVNVSSSSSSKDSGFKGLDTS
jgi:hypothetical protein